ncbi:MFS transporter [Streptomyces sp. NPDC057717]|uniref:MFS transporter n=1 Tax=Streptomyces sp. NPDC057717 TaxID=3346224 RepID=UPI00368BAA35
MHPPEHPSERPSGGRTAGGDERPHPAAPHRRTAAPPPPASSARSSSGTTSSSSAPRPRSSSTRSSSRTSPRSRRRSPPSRPSAWASPSAPIGGLALAHLGDRIGRRPVLILTVVLMGAGTLAIGFLPTYHQIGIWAPVLLVLCRMMQGFGVGAELGGAYVKSTEAAKAEKRGFYGSLPGAGEFIGVVIASGAVAAVSTLPEDDFLGWGWRIPFLASALVVIIALVIRNAAPETEQFEATRDSGKREKLPVLAAIKSRPKAIALLIGSGCATAIASYAIQGYLPSYLTNQLGLSSDTSVLGITIASAISILTIPLAGALSDRVGRKPVMIGDAVAITRVITVRPAGAARSRNPSASTCSWPAGRTAILRPLSRSPR